MTGRTSAPKPKREGCRLMTARPSLAGCVFAAIERDTRDLNLAPPDRINHFPAVPYCSISLFLEGCSILADDWSAVAPCEAASTALPAIIFSGPHRRPTVSLNPGPVHVLTIGFHTEAMQALCGLHMAAYVDRTAPAREALPRWLVAACEECLALDDGAAAFDRLQNVLEAPWRAARPEGSRIAHLLSDWVGHLSARAATSGTGRSLRQIERRVKSWTGLTRRDLAAHVRAERAFIDAMSGLDAGRETVRQESARQESWAQLAADNGFSDQSHLARDVRRLTGFPPEQLRRRIRTEPAFWYYRLIGELYG